MASTKAESGASVSVTAPRMRMTSRSGSTAARTRTARVPRRGAVLFTWSGLASARPWSDAKANDMVQMIMLELCGALRRQLIIKIRATDHPFVIASLRLTDA